MIDHLLVVDEIIQNLYCRPRDVHGLVIDELMRMDLSTEDMAKCLNVLKQRGEQ